MTEPPRSADIAKAALRRIAVAKLEPTPDNFARAYALESGQPLAAEAALPPAALPALTRLLAWVGDLTQRQTLTLALRQGQWDELLRQVEQLLASDGPAAQGEAWAAALDRLVRGLERGGRTWTLARKKDGLQRVLGANKGDGARLVRRLSQLLHSWESEPADAGIDTVEVEGGSPSQFLDTLERDDAASAPTAPATAATHWPATAEALHGALQAALTPLTRALAQDAPLQELAQQLGQAHDALQADPTQGAAARALAALCDRARQALGHRQQLLSQLGGLCQELSASLAELSEDDSWTRGQVAALHDALAQGLSPRVVRSVSERLAQTRERQRALRDERAQTRDALKGLVQSLLSDIGALGEQTGRFSENVGRYADDIEQADSLESLAGLVREMVQESRGVHAQVRQTQQRLQDEHQRARALDARVQQLEGELRQLSDEAQTDQLTRVANRRGLLTAFGQAQAQQARDKRPLALALLDIDNFKRLNDELGHAAGDEALKGLAAQAQATVRPGDVVARYGGEEFVLMLPGTPLDEAVQVLTRLQRALTAGLFKQGEREVFVTFSAGATLYREGEPLEAALERADVALYEAKRSGKNRSCTA